MLDQLAALFPKDPIQNVTQLLNSVSNFAQFIEQKVEGDTAKFNEILEHIKTLFEAQKKSQ